MKAPSDLTQRKWVIRLGKLGIVCLLTAALPFLLGSLLLGIAVGVVLLLAFAAIETAEHLNVQTLDDRINEMRETIQKVRALDTAAQDPTQQQILGAVMPKVFDGIHQMSAVRIIEVQAQPVPSQTTAFQSVAPATVREKPKEKLAEWDEPSEELGPKGPQSLKEPKVVTRECTSCGEMRNTGVLVHTEKPSRRDFFYCSTCFENKGKETRLKGVATVVELATTEKCRGYVKTYPDGELLSEYRPDGTPSMENVPEADPSATTAETPVEHVDTVGIPPLAAERATS